MTFRRFLLSLLLLGAGPLHGQNSWHDRLTHALPLLGHRNWIVVAEPAYPLQTSQGIEVVATDLSQTELLTTVLDAVSRAPHIRPVFFTDAELPYVSEKDADGIGAYRAQLGTLLKGGYVTASLTHEQILAKMEDASQNYHVLVLKSTTTLPYTSVFIELYCGYWSADAEKRLRAAMPQGETAAPAK